MDATEVRALSRAPATQWASEQYTLAPDELMAAFRALLYGQSGHVDVYAEQLLVGPWKLTMAGEAFRKRMAQHATDPHEIKGTFSEYTLELTASGSGLGMEAVDGYVNWCTKNNVYVVGRLVGETKFTKTSVVVMADLQTGWVCTMSGSLYRVTNPKASPPLDLPADK